MNEQLKCCPICGTEPVIEGGNGFYYTQVICPKCNLHAYRRFIMNHPTEAIRAWNAGEFAGQYINSEALEFRIVREVFDVLYNMDRNSEAYKAVIEYHRNVMNIIDEQQEAAHYNDIMP